MGRPKEHDAATAAALLAAAERIVANGDVDALSIRGVADEVGTTTRAVYSLYGSKDGLLAALGAHAFELLGAAVRAVRTTDDPGADLVDAGLAFRRFALTHPALFAIAVQRTRVSTDISRAFVPAATDAMTALLERLQRLADDGLLVERSVPDAAWQFHALCEGLAAVELRAPRRTNKAPKIWREALAALIAGFAQAPPNDRPRRNTAPTARKLRSSTRS